MDTTGRDPLRGRFTRFLQETIKNFKTDYFREFEHRPVSPEALWQSRTDHFSEKPAAQGFDFQWMLWRRLTSPFQEHTRRSCFY